MSHRFEIFVDNGCPLCRREAAWLARLDDGRGRLRITDLMTANGSLADAGISFERAMRTIHGRHPDGTVVTGVGVFRHAYRAVDRGWLAAWTGWPLIRPLVDVIYRLFARRRFNRRSTCDDVRCRLTPPHPPTSRPSP